jgi:hypothetical protein
MTKIDGFPYFHVCILGSTHKLIISKGDSYEAPNPYRRCGIRIAIDRLR